MKILICWEDRYWRAMERALRRAVRHIAGDHTIKLFAHSVHGYGGFKPFVKRDWPKARDNGLAKSNGCIDYLICIGDADEAVACCSQAISAPPANDTQAWAIAAGETWTQGLRAITDNDQEKIFGRFVRWNRESLLISSFDHPDSQQRLGVRDQGGLIAMLATCRPDPRTLGVSFVDAYQDPSGCFKQWCAAGKMPPLRKNAVRCEDAINTFSNNEIKKLCDRVPDLTIISNLIRLIDSGNPPAS